MIKTAFGQCKLLYAPKSITYRPAACDRALELGLGHEILRLTYLKLRIPLLFLTLNTVRERTGEVCVVLL